jgi:hypothetical protein
MNRNPWVESLFRPLAIGVMSGCIALSLVGLVRLFAPTWNGTYLVAGCVLAALEANYSYQLIRARQLRGADVLRFRAFEIATFFILLKIGSYAGDRWADVLADVETWPRQPFNIIGAETAVAFILTLLSWWASTQTTRDLDQIGEPPERHRHYVPPMEKLTGRFFWGGAALLIVAGITRIGIAALLDVGRPSVPGLVLNVLVYFLLGLAMLGQAQFTRLRTQWQAQRIKIAEELASRWVRYSLALIGLAALVAFVLPTGYTVGLLDAVAAIIYVLSAIVTVLGTILSFLLGLLLAPLAMLFGIERFKHRRALPPLELPRQQPGGPGIATPGWFEILRSLLFWAVTLGMVFYVIRSYLRDRPELLQALASLGPIRALRDLLTALWRRLVGLAEAVNKRIPQQLSLWRRRKGPSETSFRFFRLGALSPRERILYYYLSILRRAGQQGFPRRRAQTPHEYDGTLRPHLPEAQQEMGRLTRDFVEARYSTHPVDREKEKQVRTRWQQVKAALRALKRQADTGRET